jgi:hypothetical protein
MTPSRLEADRPNAPKSTGPRSTRGKAQSRMNGLRSGARSRLYRDLWVTLFNAPPCAVERTAAQIFTPELALHPLSADTVEQFREAEIAVAGEFRQLGAWTDSRKKETLKIASEA